MNYFMAPEPRGLRRRGFGAEQEHGTEDIATSMKKCGENLKSYDYDSAAGRRAANKEAGRCSAEAVCTYFSQGAVPPGICGPIGAQIAEWVGAAFETIFGTDKYAEWLKNYQARQGMENEAALISAKLDAFQAILDAAVETATAAMIVAWDSSVPDARGKLGGGQELTFVWDPKFLKATGTPTRTTTSTVSGLGSGTELEWVHLFNPPVQVVSVEQTAPAAYVLMDFGADLEQRTSGRFRAPDITLPVAANERALIEARAYLKTVEQAFVPNWLKKFHAAVGKAQAFVTESATREQARITIAKHEQALIAAEAVGEQKSKRLNLALLGAGALVLGGVWYATRRK